MIEFNVRKRDLYPELIWVDETSEDTRSILQRYNKAWKIEPVYLDYANKGRSDGALMFDTGLLDVFRDNDKMFTRGSQHITTDGVSLRPEALNMVDAIMFEQMIKRWLKVHGKLIPSSVPRPSTKRVFKLGAL